MRRLDWRTPDFAAAFDALVEAPRAADAHVDGMVARIIADVRSGGDAALVALTERFDRFTLTPAAIEVSPAEQAEAASSVPPATLAALDLAAVRIAAFHERQLPADLDGTDEQGFRLGMRWTPLDAVGIYVPGGKAAYPSSVLMNAVPARIAGVSRIAMCVPTPDGALNPLVMAAAQRAGVHQVFRVGGAQAIAALAWGTATIAPVDRIVGPGNAYVASAKRQVFGRVGIDSIAGPSEVVILADGANDPRHVALDLLAQAEHDEVAQAILITDDAAFADAVAAAVAAELPALPRARIAGASWRNHGAIVIASGWQQAATLTNRLAPEHLQVMVADSHALLAQIRHAGAAFLGRWCPEAVGDYVAGPNHVLPTGRTARHASGLSVFDFLKRTTWVECGRAALAAVGPAAISLAEAEGLHAHARSIAIRLQNP